MKEGCGRGIIGLTLAMVLFAAIPAYPGAEPNVVNLAGNEATCLKDPDQMTALQRQRAMFSSTAHRSLAIIALARTDAEPLIGAGQLLRSCRSCGSSPNEIWVCIGDAVAVQRKVAPGKPLPQPASTPAQVSATPANLQAASEAPVAQPPPQPSERVEHREPLPGGPDSQQARELAHTKRWQDLEDVAHRWRQSDPRSAPALFYSGLAAEFTGQERDASSYYADAVRLDPSLAGAQFGYARSLMRSGEYQQAIDALQNVVRAFPSEARAWGDLGLAYMHADDLADATRALQHAVDLAPDDNLNCGLAAQAYALGNRLDVAAALLERGIRKQPFDSTNVNWMRDLGAIYFYSGEYQRSAQLFDRTLRYDRGDPSTFYYLWQDYTRLGDAANAAQAQQTMASLITPQHRLHTESLTSYINRVHRWEHEAYIYDLTQLNLDAQLP